MSKRTTTFLEKQNESKMVHAEMAMGHRLGDMSKSVRKSTASILIPVSKKNTAELTDTYSLHSGPASTIANVT